MSLHSFPYLCPFQCEIVASSIKTWNLPDPFNMGCTCDFFSQQKVMVLQVEALWFFPAPLPLSWEDAEAGLLEDETCGTIWSRADSAQLSQLKPQMCERGQLKLAKPAYSWPMMHRWAKPSPLHISRISRRLLRKQNKTKNTVRLEGCVVGCNYCSNR